jgi:hypothetical protein
MVWTSDEFKAKAPSARGGCVARISTLLDQFHRAPPNERPQIISKTLKNLDKFVNSWLGYVIEEDDDFETIDAMQVLMDQLTEELALPKYQNLIREAVNVDAVQAVQNLPNGLTEHEVAPLRRLLQRRRFRRNMWPVVNVDEQYISEVASMGYVGKELGPQIYSVWESDGSPDTFGNWLQTENGRKAVIGATVLHGGVDEMKHVTYLDPQDRPPYMLSFNNGIVYRGQENQPFDSNNGDGETWAIFVLDHSHNFYLGWHDTGLFHHSSFLQGESVRGAGKMKIDHGVIKFINQHSGHYGPGEKSTLAVLRSIMMKIQYSELKEENDTRKMFEAIGIKRMDGEGGNGVPALDFLKNGGF